MVYREPKKPGLVGMPSKKFFFFFYICIKQHRIAHTYIYQDILKYFRNITIYSIYFHMKIVVMIDLLFPRYSILCYIKKSYNYDM